MALNHVCKGTLSIPAVGINICMLHGLTSKYRKKSIAHEQGRIEACMLLVSWLNVSYLPRGSRYMPSLSTVSTKPSVPAQFGLGRRVTQFT